MLACLGQVEHSQAACPSHVAWIGIVLSIVAIAGCGGNGADDVRQRVAVSGQVSLDGRPLNGAAIVFTSVDDESDSPSIVAYGFVENGRYQLDAAGGPAVGKARVSFVSKPLERGEFEEVIERVSRSGRRARPTVVDIPPHCGEASTMEVEFLSDGENQKDFQLSSRSG